MATSREQTTQEQQLPPPDGDFYGIVGTLSREDRSLLSRVRAFMEEKVAPIINDYWMRDEFPFDVLPAMSDLGISRHTLRGLRLPRERHTGLFGREDGEQDGVACGAKRPHHAR